ncbi:GTP cyclohydrolase [Deltaproteobacteria bacterium]|nr:GTP cyclohydrolase [Deltaproteobacteria bacterium]
MDCGLTTEDGQNMADVQNDPASLPLNIDTVGVKRLKLPLVVSDREKGAQHTVALVDLGVDLPASFKGTHMSRFVEALEGWKEELSYKTMKLLLEDIKTRLNARKAYARFSFPYFIRKCAPVSGACGLMAYECRLTGELVDARPTLTLEVSVPVMTVCPCSKAISVEGAHSQRAEVRFSVRMSAFCWIEECVVMAEEAGSSPVYPVLKREDEKYVTEHAFAKPVFVEDVVRSVAAKLDEHPVVTGYLVEVESQESIHGHNAFARMMRDKREGVTGSLQARWEF